MFVPNFKSLDQIVPEISLTKISIFITLRDRNQRTNGPVNAHLIFGPSKSTKQTKPENKYEKDLINNN